MIEAKQLEAIRDSVARASAEHRCVLAIVGSRTLAGESTALMAIRGAFDAHRPRSFVSGGAPGIDQMAEKEADLRHCKKAICYPTFNRWQPKGYKERNTQIAQLCDHLVRISDCQSKTYGSGWTARKAERLGKQVEEIVICTCGRVDCGRFQRHEADDFELVDHGSRGWFGAHP